MNRKKMLLLFQVMLFTSSIFATREDNDSPLLAAHYQKQRERMTGPGFVKVYTTQDQGGTVSTSSTPTPSPSPNVNFDFFEQEDDESELHKSPCERIMGCFVQVGLVCYWLGDCLKGLASGLSFQKAQPEKKQ